MLHILYQSVSNSVKFLTAMCSDTHGNYSKTQTWVIDICSSFEVFGLLCSPNTQCGVIIITSRPTKNYKWCQKDSKNHANATTKKSTCHKYTVVKQKLITLETSMHKQALSCYLHPHISDRALKAKRVFYMSVGKTSIAYHICVGLCSRFPLTTRKPCFILKNLICELCVACICFCQQTLENTTIALRLIRGCLTQAKVMQVHNKQIRRDQESRLQIAKAIYSNFSMRL